MSEMTNEPQFRKQAMAGRVLPRGSERIGRIAHAAPDECLPILTITGTVSQCAAAQACSKQPQATDPPFAGEQDSQAGQAFGVRMRALHRHHGAASRQLSAALSIPAAIHLPAHGNLSLMQL